MPAQNYSLDRLADYRTEAISEPLQVVNPTTATSTGRSALPPASSIAAWQLCRHHPERAIEPKHVEPFLRRKASLQEEIEALQRHLDTLKAKRKETPHHIAIEELPEEVAFASSAPQSKHLGSIPSR